MSKDINAAFAGISGVHVTPYDQSGEIDENLLKKW